MFFALFYEFEKIRNDPASIYNNAEQVVRINGNDKSNSIFDTYAIHS